MIVAVSLQSFLLLRNLMSITDIVCRISILHDGNWCVLSTDFNRNIFQEQILNGAVFENFTFLSENICYHFRWQNFWRSPPLNRKEVLKEVLWIFPHYPDIFYSIQTYFIPSRHILFHFLPFFFHQRIEAQFLA